jgi:glycosyltransferase involved in cell wall biosynthesis
MRIINTVLGDAAGGRWQVVVDYVNVLTEMGHEVVLLAASKKVSPTTLMPDQAEVKTIRNSGHYDMLATLAARKIIWQWQPDLIIAHCSRSVALMKRASHHRITVVGVSHSNNVKRMARADAFFNISTHIGKEINRLGGEGKPAFHIPNMFHGPVNAEYLPRPWRQPPVIGALGRFDPVKGFHILLQSALVLHQRGCDFQLLLGGAGVQKEELREICSEARLDDKVKFVGWVQDVPSFFQSVDLVCIPALSDAFGLTPLDASIHSTPVILSTAPGHRDMFEDKYSALYFALGDPDALADALEYALGHPETMKQMSAKAFQRTISEYNAELFKQRLGAALEALVAC